MQLVGPGIESEPLAMKVQSPNYWTGREFPSLAVCLFVCFFLAYGILLRGTVLNEIIREVSPRIYHLNQKKKKERIKRENKHAYV